MLILKVKKLPKNVSQIWARYYCLANNSRHGMTFHQIYGIFYYELGYYPPVNLPLMPVNPLEWSLKVKDVPRERLIQPKKNPVAS